MRNTSYFQYRKGEDCPCIKIFTLLKITLDYMNISQWLIAAVASAWNSSLFSLLEEQSPHEQTE